MSTLTARMIGSAKLQADSYEEVEADSSANGQAVAVVVLSSLAAALGTGTTSVPGAVALLFAAILSWLVWVFLTLWLGTRVMPGRETRADFGQVLRTTGFSAAPGILRVLGVVPVVGWIIFLGATIWMLLSFVIAIRQALDYSSTGSAFAVCLLGWIIHGILFFGFVVVAS